MSNASHSLHDEGIDLDELHAFTVQLAKDAGQMLLDAAEARVGRPGSSVNAGAGHVVEKESAVDLVTQTDEDVEAFIRKSVQSRYPAHLFVGEESYGKNGSKEYLIPKSGPAWCVDPLDGTVNFIHLCPFYCVSIAFILDGEPVLGAVNAPFLRQLFTACRGKGAFLNETTQLPLDRSPVPPMPESAPKGCVLSCEWGKDRRDTPQGNLHRKVDSFLNLASETGGRQGKGGHVHGVRSLGSATLDLCYVAMGSFDIWWEGGCWEWDVAAGICILKESGGLVTTANPPSDQNIVPEAHLGSRLYLAIRPAGDSPTETGRQSQERTVRQVWRRVETLDYSRPGI
ncbi:inositol monophosphatase [Lecanosticta acicola]|uniref:Inositol-1-monophosphatase n=1 Tax=Lecanosticta acicola TaxID=111012 RepID=A0AAI8Z144_9PEZI|nr:inositol monophosphatase [Lecanosticta acicola]